MKKIVAFALCMLASVSVLAGSVTQTAASVEKNLPRLQFYDQINDAVSQVTKTDLPAIISSLNVADAYVARDIAVAASADYSTNALAMTSRWVVIKATGEAQALNIPAPGTAKVGTLVTIITASTSGTNSLKIVDSATVEIGSDLTLGIHDNATLLGFSATKWLCIAARDNDAE